jgi:hypothetical protein
MSKDEKKDKENVKEEREKLNKLGVTNTWDLLSSKKKKGDKK